MQSCPHARGQDSHSPCAASGQDALTTERDRNPAAALAGRTPGKIMTAVGHRPPGERTYSRYELAAPCPPRS
jgi:hypothetical protein